MILERIRQQYPQLTKSQRRLADFIASAYQDAAFMTASRLAAEVGVNEATVIRFAQRLGYRGYPEMVAAIQAIVQDDLQPGAAVVTDERDAPFFHTLATESDLLQRAIRQVDPAQVERARQWLGGATRVVVTGEGLGAALADYLGAALLALGRPALAAPLGSLGLAGALEALDGDAVLVGVNTGRGGAALARALLWARTERGAHTVALTESALSPCARAAEVALASSSGEPEALPAAGLLMALVDGLLQGLLGADEQATERLRAAQATQERLCSGG